MSCDFRREQRRGGECNAVALVPIDLDCDGECAAPDARTVTMEELRAMRMQT